MEDGIEETWGLFYLRGHQKQLIVHNNKNGSNCKILKKKTIFLLNAASRFATEIFFLRSINFIVVFKFYF